MHGQTRRAWTWTVVLLAVTAGAAEAGVEVREEAAPGGGWLRGEVLEPDGSRRKTERAWVASGWHRLGVRWDSGAAIAPQGRLQLVVDGAVAAAPEGLAVGTVVIEAVELGAMEAEADGGWVDADDYESSRGLGGS